MKNKIKAILLALTLTVSSIPFSGITTNAVDLSESYTQEVDWSLWERFLKYDLCITDYDSLTDEEKELCKFIFETEQSSNGTVRCERARRIIAGDDNIGERITLEQLEGAYGIWDKFSPTKVGWYSYIHCVPDIKIITGLYNEYWLNDEGTEKVVFTGEDLYYSEYDSFIVYPEDSRSYSIDIADMPFGNFESKSWTPDTGITLDLTQAIEYNEDYYYITPENEAVLLKGGACGTGPDDISEPITEPHIIPDEINGCPVTAIENDAFLFSPYTEIVLPETIEYIDNGAFWYNTYLEKINFPKSLKFLGNKAFCETALKEIEIDCPNLYTSYSSFSTHSLTDVTINAKVIGERTFAGCENLKNVTLGENVEKIDIDAFHSCSSIENISFPASLKAIAQGAFLGENWGEDGIKSITIPPTVEIIGALPKQKGDIPEVSIPTGTHPLTDKPVCVFDSDCVINGYYNTEAHRYAVEWGLKFNPIDPADYYYGDTNRDGLIDPTDATLALRQYALASMNSEDLLSDGALTAADVNADGAIDPVDATWILRYYSYASMNGEGSLEEFITNK